MAATGALFWLVVNRWGVGERLRRAMPVVMIGLLAGVPSYYKVLAKSEDNPGQEAPTRVVKEKFHFGAELGALGLVLTRLR